jgi:DNA gyrase/topoisomerase IV subunit A
VLEALVTALSDLPALLAIVTESVDTDAALSALEAHFGVSRPHAVAILDLQVGRMSKEGRARVVEERDALVDALANP